MDHLKKYKPEFKHVNDAVAFAVHSTFLNNNLKLVGLNEEENIDDLGSVPQGWNKSHECYTFNYVNKENNKQTILVKVIPISDDELMISAIKDGKDAVHGFDIHISDHINNDDIEDNIKASDYEKLYKNIDSLALLIAENVTNKVFDKKKKDENEDKNKDNKEDNENNDKLKIQNKKKKKTPL